MSTPLISIFKAENWSVITRLFYTFGISEMEEFQRKLHEKFVQF
jgi:hypothetical protein